MTRNQIALDLLENIIQQNVPKDIIIRKTTRYEVTVFTMTKPFRFSIYDSLFSIYEKCLEVWKIRSTE